MSSLINSKELYTKLKFETSNWLLSLKTRHSNFDYKLSSNTESSPFTICFALFILDLFNLTDLLTTANRKIISDTIKNYQDEETGLYIPENLNAPLISKLPFQLTAFSLSALSILDEKPKYTISILNDFNSREKIIRYLEDIHCGDGKSGSGNMAMFIAIFLTHELNRTGIQKYEDLLDCWFDYHNSKQNKSTGFWGNWSKGNLRPNYFAFQNAYHQFEIYHYHKKKIPNIDKIIDRILSIQGSHGSFSPGIRGGYGSCWEFDAANILANSIKNKVAYRTDEVLSSLKQLRYCILRNQNSDGGFPQLKSQDISTNYIEYFGHIINGGVKSLLWWERSYLLLSKGLGPRRNNQKLYTGWTKSGRKISESNLWDTWFSIMTIGLIDTVLYKNQFYKFHDSIGIGYF